MVFFGSKAKVAVTAASGNEGAMQPVDQHLFDFQPRWKEELVVTGNGGSFVLEHPMGVPTVYLPTEDEWPTRAPLWALGLWGTLKHELEQWCRDNDIRLEIDASADLFAS